MEINSDEEQEQENIFNEINGNINQLEINDDRIIVAHQWLEHNFMCEQVYLALKAI